MHSSVIFRALAWFGILALGLSLVYCYRSSLLWGMVNFDAGYYLPLASKLAAGAIPYAEVPMRYTPLGIYFLVLPYFVYTQQVDYIAFQILIGVFQFTNICLLFWISKFIKAGNKTRIFFSLSAIVPQYTWTPLHIGLEQFFVFFGLIGILAAFISESFRGKWLIAGFSCGLSFLCKQYGLMFLMPICFLALTESRPFVTNGAKKTILLLTGFAAPVCFTFLYILQYQISLSQFLFQLKGHGYFSGFQDPLNTIKVIISYFPLIILLPLILIKGADSLRIKLFTILFLISTLSPFLLKSYAHYFIPLTISISLLCIQIYSSFLSIAFPVRGSPSKIQRLLGIMGCAVIVSAVLSEAFLCLQKAQWIARENPRAQQFKNAQKIGEISLSKSRVLCIADQSLYYLGNFEPPLNVFYGYIGDISRGRFSRVLVNTNLIIDDRRLDKDYFHQSPYLRRAIRRKIIRRAGFLPASTVDARYTLWKRRVPA